jgi:hypothetical protein
VSLHSFLAPRFAGIGGDINHSSPTRWPLLQSEFSEIGASLNGIVVEYLMAIPAGQTKDRATKQRIHRWIFSFSPRRVTLAKVAQQC